ncbi:MAG TPA: hypothetical protein VF664_01940 [Cystobacter sp.]|jgi:hypothetical protein
MLGNHSEHTEVIVTGDARVAGRITREAQASAVVWNASTRFNDGGELVHAFGLMGLRELTSQKYVIHGQGQVRQALQEGYAGGGGAPRVRQVGRPECFAEEGRR